MVITGNYTSAIADKSWSKYRRGQCTFVSRPRRTDWSLRSYATGESKHLELGSEPTIAEYLANQVGVFREVRRVLRDDGIVWCNMGDSYSSAWPCKRPNKVGNGSLSDGRRENRPDMSEGMGDGNQYLIPHRFALAMQADGWVLRSTVVWHKKSPMPESVNGWRWEKCRVKQGHSSRSVASSYHHESTNGKPHGARDGKEFASSAKWADCPGCSKCSPNGGWILRRGAWRCTTAHEYIFMFSKAKMSTDGWGQFGHISEPDARWVALFVETEGNICIKRVKPSREGLSPTYGVQIAVANSFRPLLEELVRITGTGTIHSRSGKNAPVYYWQLGHKEGADLLIRIYPYLFGKRRQAKLGIYLESLKSNSMRTCKKNAHERLPLFEKIWMTNKACNHFHDPDMSWCPEPKQVTWKPCDYFADAQNAQEDAVFAESERTSKARGEFDGKGCDRDGREPFRSIRQSRNPRSVWSLSSEPLKAKHFAAFPSALVHHCLKPSISPGGCCAACGAQYAPMVEKVRVPTRPGENTKTFGGTPNWSHVAGSSREEVLSDRKLPSEIIGNRDPERHVTATNLLGYRATCGCNADKARPVVLDPYCGSGTTGRVAIALGCDFIGIELSEQYAREIAVPRLETPWTPKKAKAKRRQRTRPAERMLF